MLLRGAGAGVVGAAATGAETFSAETGALGADETGTWLDFSLCCRLSRRDLFDLAILYLPN